MKWDPSGLDRDYPFPGEFLGKHHFYLSPGTGSTGLRESTGLRTSERRSRTKFFTHLRVVSVPDLNKVSVTLVLQTMISYFCLFVSTLLLTVSGGLESQVVRRQKDGSRHT